MECSVGAGDSLTRKFQILNTHQLEREMINARMKGASKESEDDKGAAPYSPARPLGANQFGERGDGRPHQNVARHEDVIGGAHQGCVLFKGRKLLGEKEVKLVNLKKRPDKKEKNGA